MKKTEVKNKYKKYFMTQKKLTTNNGKTVEVLNYNIIDDFVDELIDDNNIKLETKVLIIVMLSGGLRVSEALSLKKSDFFLDRDNDWLYHIGVLKKRKKISYANVLTQKCLDLSTDSAERSYRNSVKRWVKFLGVYETSSIKGEFNTFHNKRLIEFEKELSKDEDLDKKSISKHVRNISSLKKYYDHIRDPNGGIVRVALLNPSFNELFVRWRNIRGNNKFLFDFGRTGALSRVKTALGKEVTNHTFRHSYISYKLFSKENSETPEKLAKRMRIGLSVIQNYTHVDEYAASKKDWPGKKKG